ncbi:alanine--tRNA ligase [Candidatus Dependentiae bacterium]|nr:alanine--tRNA ligase [Candidatus Dependentiae bacterium]
MDSFKIRQRFLDFFKNHNHIVVPSSSLIPAEDPTLLFTNAGMNQFKDVFLGHEKRAYVCATSSQKCVRAGGKHNDLDEVGFTNRHLTFFEMLGNFSFGDYFKKEAILFAWEFLTKEMGLDPDSLCVSVYKTDDEAYKIWNKDMKIPAERIYRLGEADNFWQMGDTGPCGPCTEIHMDMGSGAGCKTRQCDPSCSCGRFVEIWNLVFMQYNRQADGTLKPLVQTGVDTGMGLERLCMVIQKKESVFETDLFSFLIKKIEQLTGISYASASSETKGAFHALSDHVRSSSLLIADGCSPSNDGRGYVLRKIIRRAALFARKLSDDQELFTKLVKTFIEVMALVFEGLETSKPLLVTVLQSEIDRFAVSLDQGQQIFDSYVEKSKKAKQTLISGEQVFKLYDTYGFPPELTRVMAHEHTFTVDMEGFEREMAKQRAQSGRKVDGEEKTVELPDSITTKFVGYDALETASKISFVQYDRESNVLSVVTEETPFYVESGGQTSDTGWITIDDHSYPVKSLRKVGVGENAVVIAHLEVDSLVIEKAKKIAPGDTAHAVVDFYTRKNSEKNHTATHLLQAALVQVLGPQVKQAGSLVCGDHLRFDYTHHEAMTPLQIKQVEQIINQKIQDNIQLNIFSTTLKQAKAEGVTAFFGEKYDPGNVRVVQVPGFSAELCGGTHVRVTGEIGLFKITSDAALATGTRRITAVSGPGAVALLQEAFSIVKTLGEQYKVKSSDICDSIERQQAQYQEALRTIKQLRKKLLRAQIPVWYDLVSVIGKVPFLFLSLDGYGNDELKTICQEIGKEKPGFYFLLSCGEENRFSFVGYVSKSFIDTINLRELSKSLKESCNLRGGGSPGFIQGGGVGIDVDAVKSFVESWVQNI